jgi:prepilin-type processing-associated H-X9-DG protein
MKARSMTCEANLKKLSFALLIYAEEHKNHLPDAAHWREAIRPYLKPGKPLVVCLDAKIGDGYAMEPRLSKIDLDTLENPSETILLYETDAPDQKPRPPLTKTRHGAPNIAFVDGRVKYGYGAYQQKLHERSDALLTRK